MHTKYQVGSQVSEDVVNVKSNRPGRPRHLNGKRCAITTDSSWLGTFADADGAGRGLIACVCRRMRAVLKSRRPKKQVCATSAYCLLPTAYCFAARGEGCPRRAHGHLEGFFGNAGYEGLDEPAQSGGNVAGEGN